MSDSLCGEWLKKTRWCRAAAPIWGASHTRLAPPALSRFPPHKVTSNSYSQKTAKKSSISWQLKTNKCLRILLETILKQSFDYQNSGLISFFYWLNDQWPHPYTCVLSGRLMSAALIKRKWKERTRAARTWRRLGSRPRLWAWEGKAGLSVKSRLESTSASPNITIS